MLRILYIRRRYIGAEKVSNLDAYLEEELYDTLVYCIHNPRAADLESKRNRAEEIGKDLFSDGGIDSMENMFYSIECRLRDEIHKDANPYRSWWNGITPDWKY
ncbi:MAG TPA: hypothetical protein VH415_01875 [Nitrososphaeraceae archaeon]|jgi:hypothetical protein